jgi:hypothetical protein
MMAAIHRQASMCCLLGLGLAMVLSGEITAGKAVCLRQHVGKKLGCHQTDRHECFAAALVAAIVIMLQTLLLCLLLIQMLQQPQQQQQIPQLRLPPPPLIEDSPPHITSYLNTVLTTLTSSQLPPLPAVLQPGQEPLTLKGYLDIEHALAAAAAAPLPDEQHILNKLLYDAANQALMQQYAAANRVEVGGDTVEKGETWQLAVVKQLLLLCCFFGVMA